MPTVDHPSLFRMVTDIVLMRAIEGAWVLLSPQCRKLMVVTFREGLGL
jgi:hypothetical protein